MVAFVRKGKRPGIWSLLKAAPKSTGFPPQPTGAEYQYGTHEAAIKGSFAAGYGVVFGAFLALASNAMLQHKGSFTQTVPQVPLYQQSSVNPPSPALYTVAAQTPALRGIVQTWPQEQQQNAPSTVFRQQLTSTDVTFPTGRFIATVAEQPPEVTSVVSTFAVRNEDLPVPRPWVETRPQENQQNAPSAVYGRIPSSQAAARPALTSAVVTQAQQPDTTQSSVRTVNIALALAAPPLRSAIVTQAEQPLPAPSLVIPATGALPIQSPIIRLAISTQAETPLQAPSLVIPATSFVPLQPPRIGQAMSTVAEQPLTVPSWTMVTTAYTPSAAPPANVMRVWIGAGTVKGTGTRVFIKG